MDEGFPHTACQAEFDGLFSPMIAVDFLQPFSKQRVC